MYQVGNVSSLIHNDIAIEMKHMLLLYCYTACHCQ